MNEQLKEFFEKREKELNKFIAVQEEAAREGYSIPYEHYWGRRAELRYIREKLKELLEVKED